MPKFAYKAKEGPSKIVNGIVDADSQESAINKILALRLTPLDVSLDSGQPAKIQNSNLKFKFSFSKNIKSSDLVVFTRQMSDLVDASVPILRALQIASNQTTNLKLKEMIIKMAASVKDGGSFSDSLSKYPKLFSNLYVNMVRSGEVSGQLEKVLSRLANYQEKQQETTSKIKSSLAYPILIMVVGVLTVFVLLTFVIPRLTVMFDDLNQELPLPTLILVNLSSFFARFWWLMIGAGIFASMAFKQWSNTDKAKFQIDQLKLKMIFFGDFIKIVEVSRICRTLATLLESGVTITAALKSVSGSVENILLKQEVLKIAEQVTQGSSLKTSLKNSKIFPDMAINMISVAEESGRLERGLYKIADVYDKQSDETVKTIVSILGPLVLVVIVSIVGFVVMAMLLPIFKMNMVVQ